MASSQRRRNRDRGPAVAASRLPVSTSHSREARTRSRMTGRTETENGRMACHSPGEPVRRRSTRVDQHQPSFKRRGDLEWNGGVRMQPRSRPCMRVSDGTSPPQHCDATRPSAIRAGRFFQVMAAELSRQASTPSLLPTDAPSSSSLDSCASSSFCHLQHGVDQSWLDASNEQRETEWDRPARGRRGRRSFALT